MEQFLTSPTGYEVEYCNNCEREIELRWDINLDGFQAICPVCGSRLMLCDACQHRKEDVSEYNPIMGCVTQGDCDYCTETDSCRFSRPQDWWKVE